MSSHSGLWRRCRYTSIPYALPDARVPRNFTSIAYQTNSTIQEAKMKISKEQYIDEFLSIDVTPINNFTDDVKRGMFAHWVKNDTKFQHFKEQFISHISALPECTIPLKNESPIELNSNDIKTKTIFGDSVLEVKINNTDLFIIAPIAARIAIFNGWNERQYVPKLFWPYAKDLGIPAYVINSDGYRLHLIPPKPLKDKKHANGFEYTPNSK